jgi:hypothetical protein
VELDFDRIPRWSAILAALGAAAIGYKLGPRPAAAFLIGAIGSYWNFRSWRRLVARIADSVTEPAVAPGFGSALLILLRLFLLAVGAFVILRYSRESLVALLMGLFVSFAAVLVEILVAFIYART